MTEHLWFEGVPIGQLILTKTLSQKERVSWWWGVLSLVMNDERTSLRGRYRSVVIEDQLRQQLDLMFLKEWTSVMRPTEIDCQGLYQLGSVTSLTVRAAQDTRHLLFLFLILHVWIIAWNMK